MNYQKHYDSLVSRAIGRALPAGTYAERHHIIPKCLGGTDAKENIVKLTPEEHFVAHQLLLKINKQSSKLVFATRAMTIKNSDHKRNNKMYGWLKRKFSETMKMMPISEARVAAGINHNTGKKASEEAKKKMSEAKLGRPGNKHNACSKEKISSALKGRKFSEESRMKMAAAKIGKKISEETKAKMSLSHKARFQ